MTDRGPIQLSVNGERHTIESVPPDRVLAGYLRGDIGATDVKLPCEEGACGACAVLLDGRPILSCLTPLHRVAGRQVETASYLSNDELGQALLAAFVRHGALQCGYCTPGWFVAAHGLLSLERVGHQPLREWLENSLVGHLCRCTGYRSILDAIEEVAVGRFDAWMQPIGSGNNAVSTGSADTDVATSA